MTRCWAGLLRAGSSPGAIRRVLHALREVDVRALLSRVTRHTHEPLARVVSVLGQSSGVSLDWDAVVHPDQGR